MLYIPTDKDHLMNLALSTADLGQIPGALLVRLIDVESAWDPWVTRYEPRFWGRAAYEAGLPPITSATDGVQQATSWGLCQIMGTTARQLGYQGRFPALCEPHRNLRLACDYLHELKHHLGLEQTWRWAITAYNHGPGWERIDPSWLREGYTAKFDDVLAELGEA